MEKVSLSKLQMNLLGMSLEESKSNVDKLLDGIEVEIAIEEHHVALQFIEEASKIGVVCFLK